MGLDEPISAQVIRARPRDLPVGECVLSRRVVAQSLNPSVLGPGAACVQGKRRLGRPSVESLNTMREALAAGAGDMPIAHRSFSAVSSGLHCKRATGAGLIA